MSWKCSFCDTYNEDGTLQCFVCGEARPAESIRAEALRKREERLESINQKLFGKIYSTLRVAFIVGLAMGVGALGIGAISKIINRGLDETWFMLVSAIKYMSRNVTGLFDQAKFAFLLTTVKENFLLSYFFAVQPLALHAYDNTKTIANVGRGIAITVQVNVPYAFAVIRILFRRIVGHIQ